MLLSGHCKKSCLRFRIDNGVTGCLRQLGGPYQPSALKRRRTVRKANFQFLILTGLRRASPVVSVAVPVRLRRERSEFDPRSLFRMVNMGLTDELLKSPTIWLCLDCGRCTAACSQLFDGRAIVRRLKDDAIQKGIIDRNFLERLKQANRLVYSRWFKEVDALFGFKGEAIRSRTTSIIGFSVCCEEYQESTFARTGG